VELTAEQRATFARDGYVVIPGVVDRPRVETARQLINNWIFCEFDHHRRVQYYAQSFGGDVQDDPRIIGLLTETPALDLATQLVGRRLAGPDRAQIALRFPVPPGAPPFYAGAHVDGVPTGINGVPADGEIHGFTVNACVLLSDLTGPDQGNFTVWPGSHLTMARWFAEHGPRVPDPDAFFAATEEVANATSAPLPITGRAGDLILAHHLTAHANGGHSGPDIRYAVFFRLTSDVRYDLGDTIFTDPWAEWDAMRP
jgi:hypothetical protein